MAVQLGCVAPWEPEVIPFTTNDLQIDGSGEADTGNPRICVADSTVYAEDLLEEEDLLVEVDSTSGI